MEICLHFPDNTDREVSVTFQHDDASDQNVCRIIADYKPTSEDLEGCDVEFSVDTIEQLDDIISALQYIRHHVQQDIERKTPTFKERMMEVQKRGMEHFAQKWLNE